MGGQKQERQRVHQEGRQAALETEHLRGGRPGGRLADRAQREATADLR